MTRNYARRSSSRSSSPRATRGEVAILLALTVALLAVVGCAPALSPATPTSLAPTTAPAPSPTAEVKAALVTAISTTKPAPTLAPSPTAQPSPTDVSMTATPVAVGSGAATPLPTSTPIAAASYPRVDGSTSTQPLEILAACRRLGVPCQWSEEVTASGTERKVIPGPSAVRMPPLQHTGTNQSYMALIEDKTDLILVARLPSEDEQAAAARAGVKLDIRPVALDAFAILVHRANPIENLTAEQIRSIYTGKVTNWTQLGGEAIGGEKGRIHPYRRPRNSGSQELMESLVMKGAKMVEANEMVRQGMEGMMIAVNEDQHSVGYMVYYYASMMLSYGNIKMIGVEGVKPTTETIASKTYPLVAEVYVATRAELPASHPAAIMRDWWLGSEGQAVVDTSGYVPLAKTR